MAPVNDRIEAAIEKLTTISIDLKAMIAVHDQRLGQQEKIIDTINAYLEKRREEMDIKLKEVYDTTEAHKMLTAKINQMERYIWLAIGGGITATWIISMFANYFKILGH
jgi:sulfatase maturation enzyme AslB (radical SAM superfamily)